LLERDDSIVYFLVREAEREALGGLYEFWGCDGSRAIPVVGDLTQPLLGVAAVDRKKLGKKTTHFFHLAAIYDLSADAEIQLKVNVDGTRNTVQFAEAIGAKHFHLFSSIAAAGLFEGLFREDMFEEAENLDHPYFRTKHDSEGIARLDHKNMTTIPLTKRGAEKLKAELHHLKHVERPAVITAIAEARAQGDLSENAEYDAAKDKQGFIEGRILEVEGKLAVAKVIDPSELDAEGRVVFGATVDLEEEESGDAVTYQIVGDDEADLKLGLISISSPIARALIGKEAGDVADVQAPGGVKRYEIIKVSYI
jgi:transcription elongation factor GreA